MPAPISADVRALFLDLGISPDDTKAETGLVIDRFTQWQNNDHAGAKGCGPCYCCLLDALPDAA
jgi:hypothetical protein